MCPFNSLIVHKQFHASPIIGSVHRPFVILNSLHLRDRTQVCSFESQPLDGSADAALQLHVAPFQIMFSPQFFDRLVAFFSVRAYAHLWAAALQIREQQQAELIAALTHHRRWAVALQYVPVNLSLSLCTRPWLLF